MLLMVDRKMGKSDSERNANQTEKGCESGRGRLLLLLSSTGHFISAVADHFALNHEDDILRDVGGQVGDSLQIP